MDGRAARNIKHRKARQPSSIIEAHNILTNAISRPTLLMVNGRAASYTSSRAEPGQAEPSRTEPGRAGPSRASRHYCRRPSSAGRTVDVRRAVRSRGGEGPAIRQRATRSESGSGGFGGGSGGGSGSGEGGGSDNGNGGCDDGGGCVWDDGGPIRPTPTMLSLIGNNVGLRRYV